MRLFLFCTLLVSATCWARGQDALGNFIPTLNSLEGAGRLAIQAKPTRKEIQSWEASANEAEPQICFPALVRLWIIGHHQDFLQLQWWKKRDKAGLGRMLILSFYECDSRRPGKGAPDFQSYLNRFAPGEQQSRQAELNLVRSDRPTIAAILAKAIRDCPPELRDGSIVKLLPHFDKVAHSK